MNQTNTSKRIPTQINEFRGDYAFLSNFYPAPVSYMGQTYANNEAAFQAQKTLSAREQRKFCIFRMHNPSDAKKLGRDLTLRPDWEKVKVRLSMKSACANSCRTRNSGINFLQPESPHLLKETTGVTISGAKSITAEKTS